MENEYPIWKKVAWRYLRVFISAFLAGFGGVLALVDGTKMLGQAADISILEFLKSLWSVAVYPALLAGWTAGISAIGKLIREKLGDKENYDSIYDKMPF